MITINGEVWRVRMVSPYHPILNYGGYHPALGCCDDITKTIYINNTQDTDSIKKVLCHEMVHAVMYSYNVDMSDYVEEIVADIFATYGNEIIALTHLVYDKYKFF